MNSNWKFKEKKNETKKKAKRKQHTVRQIDNVVK